MSEIIERYGEKIMATYGANLAFFKEKLPSLHANVMTGNAGVRIDATVDENGILSLLLDDKPLPLATLLDQAQAAMALFDSDNRPIIEVRSRESLPDYAPDEIEDPYIRDYYFSHYDFKTRFAIDAAFIRHVGREKAAALPSFGKRDIPILIVFGSGYGSHLVELLDRYRVRHLILVDNDPAITRLSMGFTDYIAIYNNHLVRNGIIFSMFCSSDADKLSQDINSAIQAHWPPFFVHGIAVFRNLRNVQLCQEVERKLSESMWLNFRGWGFFDDELLSLRHSIANLHAGWPLFTPKTPVDEKSVVFVVANGPSLDTLADLLKAHQHKAVIISCGTALSALHRLGVVPDFHLEIERPYTTVENLRHSVPAEYLAKVRIVAPTVVHPEVFHGSAGNFMFVKSGDSAGSVFPAECVQVATFPTVSNAALALAFAMGFRRAYLFGTDLGARDPKRHHSSHSVYFHKDELPDNYSPFIEQASTDSETMDMETDGNFGGKVVSSDIFTLARLSIERDIFQMRGRVEVFNLNDGARIAGTVPLKPEDFNFPGDAPEKSAVIGQVLASFGKLDNFDARTCLKKVRGDIGSLIAELKPLVALKVENKMTLVEKISRIFRCGSDAANSHPPAHWALRGSLMHMQRRIYDYASFIEDEKQAAEFSKESFEVIDRFLDQALTDVDAIDPDSSAVPEVLAQSRARKAGSTGAVEATE